jgi:hypothetical protein
VVAKATNSRKCLQVHFKHLYCVYNILSHTYVHLMVSVSYLNADTFSSVWRKSDSTYLEFLLVTLYIFGTRNERKGAKEKELMNEYHCIHIPPQGSKDSPYKVHSKPLSPEFQHQHFVCSIVVTTIAPVSPLLSA